MDKQINLAGVQKVNSFSMKNISSFLVIILSFLLPIFFIPSQVFSFLAGKDMVVIFITSLLLVLWVLERIKNKDFSVSKNLMIISAVLVPFSYLLSSLFSGSIRTTILGSGFGVNSFSMILTLFLLMFLVARLFQTKKKIIYLYVSLLFSFILISSFQILRLIFGPEFLSLGVLKTATANFIGTWSELGIFFGLITILSLLTIIFIKGNRAVKIISYISLIGSLFFVALINSFFVWLAIALSSLFLIIYLLLANKTVEQKISRKSLSVISLVIFAISLVFIFAKGPVGNFLPSFFNISNFEVRPSVGSTIDIAQATLSNDPLLGAGPNGFVKQWVANKPFEVNNSQFWNTDFNSGSSFILTTIVDIGLLGFLAWLLFFGMIIYSGVKLLKVSHRDKFNYYLAMSVFLSTVYLWFFSFTTVPGVAILGLSFLFTGVLLSLLYQERIIKIKTISLSEKLGGRIVLFVVIISFSITFIFNGYLFIKKVSASIQAQKSLIALNVEGDIGKSVELMLGATITFRDDLYYRLLSNIDLIQLQAVLNQEDVPEETIREQFQTVFQNAVANAGTAVNIDPRNYQNWMSLSKAYGSVVSLKVEGAYDKAVESYNNARSLNPLNPAIVLSLANLEIANGDIEKAKEYIITSIQMKRNYSEAYYLLSQIELHNNNEAEAIKIIEALAQETPNDPEVFLQLGFYKYNAKNYTEAIPLLERSVSLNQSLVDAVYLLGLSYHGAGEKEKAVEIFDYLSQAIPDDNNLASILDNLKNGRDPLFGIEQQSTAIPTPTTEQIIEDAPSEKVD